MKKISLALLFISIYSTTCATSTNKAPYDQKNQTGSMSAMVQAIVTLAMATGLGASPATSSNEQSARVITVQGTGHNEQSSRNKRLDQGHQHRKNPRIGQPCRGKK